MPFKDRKRKELRKVGENAWQGKISFEKLCFMARFMAYKK